MRTSFILLLCTFISATVIAQFSPQPDIAFIENKGQVTDQNGKKNLSVRYILALPGMNVQLTAKGFSYDTYVVDQTSGTTKKQRSPNKILNLLTQSQHQQEERIYKFHRVDIAFEGANDQVQIVPGKLSVDYVNYYDKISGELIQVRKIQTIIYKNLYDGIDLELTAGSGKEHPFEYSFYVHPGSDASVISIVYKGALCTKLSAKKSVLLNTIHGTLEETIPLSFEKESKTKVNVQYVQKSNDVFGFSAGNYDHTKTLVIDPTPTRVWATYYGGSVDEYLNAFNGISLSSGEDVYFTGTSESSTTIATAGSHQVNIGGGADALLVKLNSNGIRQWATYYGGTGDEEGFAVAVDASGFVILAGVTGSTSGISTAGAYQTSLAGGPGDEDGFIAKFNSSGVRQWGTYYGGVLPDAIFAMRISGTDIFFGGGTISTSGISTAGSHQASYGGAGIDTDGFFGKFNTSGARQWASYYGGTGIEYIYAINIDVNGNILVAGGTESSTGIATAGSHQPAIGAANVADGFLAKFSSSGVRQWGTYYGGTGSDFFTDIKTDNSGNVYACGGTISTTAISTAGAHQTVKSTSFDGMLVKLNSSGVRQWGTYYGGTGDGDYLFAINVLSDGTIYGVGIVSAAGSFATADAYQFNYGGGFDDGIVVKFNTNGVRQWGTYYGGNDYDDLNNIATINGTTIYVAGTTASTNAIATAGSHQATYGGGIDNIYVVKFTDVITGISRLSLENGISIYPNPARNEFIIKFNNNNTPAAVELYDVSGKLVKTERVNATISSPLRVDVKGLSTGTYLIKIWNAKQKLIGTEQLIVVE
ncbi:MAG: T9SS type A sorting domain-containing protein [Chitinophagaceae bacterium]|nr:T9SS type A sorting domain-containing protein [Chitinophagaceae bacterium]